MNELEVWFKQEADRQLSHNIAAPFNEMKTVINILKAGYKKALDDMSMKLNPSLEEILKTQQKLGDKI
jgi:hypothetical protein